MSKTILLPQNLNFDLTGPISVTRYLSELRVCTFSLIRKEFTKKMDFFALVAALQEYECTKNAIRNQQLAKYLKHLYLYLKFRKSKHPKHQDQELSSQEYQYSPANSHEEKISLLITDAYYQYARYKQLSYDSTYNSIFAHKYLTEEQKIELIAQLNSYFEDALDIEDLHPASQLNLNGIILGRDDDGTREYTAHDVMRNIFAPLQGSFNDACEQLCKDYADMEPQQHAFFKDLAQSSLAARMLYCHMPKANASLFDAEPVDCDDIEKLNDIIHEFSTSKDIAQELIERSQQLLACVLNNHAIYDFSKDLNAQAFAETKNSHFQTPSMHI